jgi:hypothetical protein
VKVLLSKIREVVFAGGNRDQLERRIRDRLRAADKHSPEAVEQLAKRLTELDRQIDQAADRLLKSSDDLVDILSPKLAAMKRERSQVADSLMLATNSNGATTKSVEGQVKATVDRLWALTADFGTKEPAKMRELLRRMVARVDFWFEPTEPGARQRNRCVRGVIELQPQFFALAGIESMC